MAAELDVLAVSLATSILCFSLIPSLDFAGSRGGTGVKLSSEELEYAKDNPYLLRSGEVNAALDVGIATWRVPIGKESMK